MSKITNVRLPNATSEYNAEQFNQLVRSLEQVIFQLNNSYTSTVDQTTAVAQAWFSLAGGAPGFAAGIRGSQVSSGIAVPFALLISNDEQASAGTTSENLVTYSSVVASNGITYTSNSRIKVPCAGQYFLSFSLQIANQSNTLSEFEVWFKKNGTNIANSNTRFDVPVRKSVSVWGHIVPVITNICAIEDPTNDYLEIAWWSDNVDVYLENYAAGTSPTRPAIPSVILTINLLSSF
jgi:hypothetical protein